MFFFADPVGGAEKSSKSVKKTEDFRVRVNMKCGVFENSKSQSIIHFYMADGSPNQIKTNAKN